MSGIGGLRAVRRFYSAAAVNNLSVAEVSRRRCELYNKEKERQLSLHPRVEKIEVKHVGKIDPEAIFVMNKGLSTPYNCAMHLSEWFCMKSVLALVDGEVWDMYKPLTKSCTIQFLSFTDEDPAEVNKAYWRSCAAILGHVVEEAFKDNLAVTLVRAPEIPVISGAFCYDVVLDSRLDDWNPTKENLHSFSKDALKFISRDLPFECLEMDERVAREIFQYNPYKLAMLEEKAAQNPAGKVTVNRVGGFVDLSEGPHISSTGVCFLYEVTAQHPLSNLPEYIRRFQGLSVPKELRTHHTVWNKLRLRAEKLVTEKPEQKPEPEAAE